MRAYVRGELKLSTNRYPMADSSPCDMNALLMAQAHLEEVLAEKAAFVPLSAEFKYTP